MIFPLGFVAFYPVQWILRPGEAGITHLLTPVMGIACFALAYMIWRRGTRTWSGTGT
jgi:ABC-2 type transport system permease protein